MAAHKLANFQCVYSCKSSLDGPQLALASVDCGSTGDLLRFGANNVHKLVPYRMLARTCSCTYMRASLAETVRLLA